MEVCDNTSSVKAGWQVLTLNAAPKFDIIFGISAKTKTGSNKSGDSYSVIKLKDGKKTKTGYIDEGLKLGTEKRKLWVNKMKYKAEGRELRPFLLILETAYDLQLEK